jgi:hypothetical protein
VSPCVYFVVYAVVEAVSPWAEGASWSRVHESSRRAALADAARATRHHGMTEEPSAREGDAQENARHGHGSRGTSGPGSSPRAPRAPRAQPRAEPGAPPGRAPRGRERGGARTRHEIGFLSLDRTADDEGRAKRRVIITERNVRRGTLGFEARTVLRSGARRERLPTERELAFIYASHVRILFFRRRHKLASLHPHHVAFEAPHLKRHDRPLEHSSAAAVSSSRVSLTRTQPHNCSGVCLEDPPQLRV